MFLFWHKWGAKNMSINEIFTQMQKESNNIKNKLIIDDIFDISHGLFNTYDDYVKYKQKIIDDVRNFNNRCLTIKEEKYILTYYVEPIIINEHDFNYIINKYLRRIKEV